MTFSCATQRGGNLLEVRGADESTSYVQLMQITFRPFPSLDNRKTVPDSSWSVTAFDVRRGVMGGRIRRAEGIDQNHGGGGVKICGLMPEKV